MTDEENDQLEEVWREHGWRTMPPHHGALEACQLLHDAGYELICVTAMPADFIEHRLENFRAHGFPIDKVISSGYGNGHYSSNPKREIIEEMHPVVFVDDLRRNFRDIQGVHTKMIYIDREYEDDPCGTDPIHYDAKYPSLIEFVKDFLRTERHGEEINWPERPAHLVPST